MKIYMVIINDYDMCGDEGFYMSKEKAKARLQELKKNPTYLWKKHLEIRVKEVIE